MTDSKKVTLKHLTPLIVFVVIAIFLGIGLTLNPKLLPSAKLNQTAPEFRLNDLLEADSSFSPSQLRGQKWILNVWASWCVACRTEHPFFNEIAAKTNIVLVGLNYKDQSDQAKSWLQQRGNPYSYIPADVIGDVGIDWGVYGVPETFVIDEQGIIVYKHTGPVNAEVINNKILPLFVKGSEKS